MKFLPFYRIVFTMAMTAIFPLVLIAGEIETMDKPVIDGRLKVFSPFQDSASARKKGSKPNQSVEKPQQRTPDERLKEAERRSIKQVPRSVPKLKPQPLTERIKVRKSE